MDISVIDVKQKQESKLECCLKLVNQPTRKIIHLVHLLSNSELLMEIIENQIHIFITK